MAYREKEPERIYWSSAQVTKLMHVTYPTLHYWLRYFDVDVKKRGGGKGSLNYRFFNSREVETLQVINHLVRHELYSLKGAKIKLELWREGMYEINTLKLFNERIMKSQIE